MYNLKLRSCRTILPHSIAETYCRKIVVAPDCHKKRACSGKNRVTPSLLIPSASTRYCSKNSTICIENLEEYYSLHRPATTEPIVMSKDTILF